MGALARLLVAYADGHNAVVKPAVDALLQAVGGQPRELVSVMGRHDTFAFGDDREIQEVKNEATSQIIVGVAGRIAGGLSLVVSVPTEPQPERD